MKVIFLFLLAAISFSPPAFATAEIYCKAVDGRSGKIDLLIGRLPVLNILSASVSAFGKEWSTNKDAKNKIVVGQAFDDKSQMFVDFTDSNVEKIIVSLRTSKIQTAKESAEAGVLKIGEAVYPVLCEG